MKLTNMIFIIVGIQMLLWLSGLNDSMGVALTDLGIQTPAAIALGWMYTKTAAILALGAGAAIVIGFFTKASTENALVAGLAVFLLKFVADLVGMIMLSNSYCEAFTEPYASCAWMTWLVVALIVPLIIVFMMAIIDWWRGRD